eukprot:9727702-Alexandrium_andersonii.AAC.1
MSTQPSSPEEVENETLNALQSVARRRSNPQEQRVRVGLDAELHARGLLDVFEEAAPGTEQLAAERVRVSSEEPHPALDEVQLEPLGLL